jgi:hypothetical protein
MNTTVANDGYDLCLLFCEHARNIRNFSVVFLITNLFTYIPETSDETS